MYYRYEISIPANTSRNNAQRRRIVVHGGIICNVDVLIPAGCAGLAYVRINHGGHPFCPVNDLVWFNGDDTHYQIREFYPLDKTFNTLFIYSYNEDDTYAHTITVGINVLPRWALLPEGATEGVLKSLGSVFLPRREVT